MRGLLVKLQYVLGMQSFIRETENPKVSGRCAKSRLRRVDFPAPEGPETAMRRGFPAKAGAISQKLTAVSTLPLQDCH